MNGRMISELDMVYVENVLQEEDHVTMTVRSCRVDRPNTTNVMQEHADVYIENMMCPPPPSQSRISDKVIEDLVIPAPNWGKLQQRYSKYIINLSNGRGLFLAYSWLSRGFGFRRTEVFSLII